MMYGSVVDVDKREFSAGLIDMFSSFIGRLYDSVAQPDNLVVLCKLKSSLFLSLEIDSLYGL